ncbi:MAG: hypothetical protein FD180_5199, partial [Planctomycetota bacterium]
MKAITCVLLAGLAVSGCVHRRYTVIEPNPGAYAGEEVYADEGLYAGDEVTYEEVEPVWDGHAFVVVNSHYHGLGCGHWYHHGCWHFFPEHHVYLEFGYSWCGDTSGFYYDGDPCARVWDGWAFLFLRGHVHGVGCGHHYHHGCWNSYARDYVHVEIGRSHFTVSPSRVRVAVSPVRVEGGTKGSGAVKSTVSPSRAGRSVSGSRVEAAKVQPQAVQPARGQQPQRIEQPQKRGQPQRVEQPQKREQPQRIEQPQKREQPQRIEPPKKREQPQRIEPPKKREQPQ